MAKFVEIVNEKKETCIINVEHILRIVKRSTEGIHIDMLGGEFIGVHESDVAATLNSIGAPLPAAWTKSP